MAQGRLAELTTDDLRFTLDEIRALFSSTYGQPLDEAACRIVADRTEGWAASLRLVSASIAAGRPDEVADFIKALSGASGPIYDFLAEEVLTRLAPETERVLMHACLVDQVRPELVTAALATTDDPPDQRVVQEALDDAERLGLLGDRSPISAGRRIHPLFRDVLEAHLRHSTTPQAIRYMHHAIAVQAERTEWLVAARHYALADDAAASMRVLGSAAGEALGTGAWGSAVEITELIPHESPPAAVKVIQARALISDGAADRAMALLTDIDRSGLTPEERGLVGLTLATIHHLNGQNERLRVDVDTVAGDASIPAPLREVALSWRQLLIATSGGCITDAVRLLRRLAADQQSAGLHYFAGVTLHNAAYAELARGMYREAHELAARAIKQLEESDDLAGIANSTQATLAAAIAEVGDIEEGLRAANAAAAAPNGSADAIADAAYLNAVCGRPDKARHLLVQFDRGDAPWSQEIGSRAQGILARASLALTQGHLNTADECLAELRGLDSPGIDTDSRGAVLAATIAVLADSPCAAALVDEALDVATRQNSWRWAARARILEAVVHRDGKALALLIGESEGESRLALLELADAIAKVVGALVPLPRALERSILREPQRWIPALSRRVEGMPGDDASAAAALISKYGSADHVGVLRRYDEISGCKIKRRGFASRLIRRVSPVVQVHDLGLTSYEVGARLVALTETRRKPSSLLIYLVTRPSFAANREQVMDSLWPDQSPKSALNSLHQTLFYLRREIEPWYEDGSTAGYVHMESDLVYLDRELFQIDSVAFARQAADILSTGSALQRGQEMLRLYKGWFAPEFEYEEWAESWRTHLHGLFLHLAHSTTDALKDQRRFAEIVEVLTPVASLDPTAFELRGTLVAALAEVGAADAAMAHYRNMVALQERDLGIKPPSFDALLKDFRGM
jgi:DNA-binding SARP family transcriptional activator